MKRPPDLYEILQDFPKRIAEYLGKRNRLGDFQAIEQRKYSDSYDMTVFSQLWSDTSTGFDGWGGQSMTPAYTTIVVFEPMNIVGVYFQNTFAYLIENPTERFYEDMANKSIVSVYDYKHRYTKTNG